MFGFTLESVKNSLAFQLVIQMALQFLMFTDKPFDPLQVIVISLEVTAGLIVIGRMGYVISPLEKK